MPLICATAISPDKIESLLKYSKLRPLRGENLILIPEPGKTCRLTACVSISIVSLIR